MVREKVHIGTMVFNAKREAETYVRELLCSVGHTSSVKNKCPKSFDILVELCKRHPEHEMKMRDFVDFIVKPNAINKTSNELNIRKVSGEVIDISWRVCVAARGKTQLSHFKDALRFAINPQIKEYRRTHRHVTTCSMCKGHIPGNGEIDHITHFEELVQTFLGENPAVAHSLPSKYDEESDTNKCCFRIEDMWIGDRFAEYHHTRATLRKVCKKCNATRTKFRTSAPKRPLYASERIA